MAFLYLRYTSPIYLRTATVLVKDSRKGSSSEVTAFNDLLGGMGRRSVDNEVHIFQSRRLMEQVVKKYDLTTRYTTQGRIRTTDMYGRSPMLAKFITAKPSEEGSFEYTIDNAGNAILSDFTDKEGPISDENKTIKAAPGDTVATPLGNIVMIATPTLRPIVIVRLRLPRCH